MAKKVRVYVDMVADLFHAGHVNFLKQAKSFGDELVVGIHSDEDVESYKRKPIGTMQERINVVKACKYVDEVVEKAPLKVTNEFLKSLNIDYICHGDDFDQEKLQEFYGEVKDKLKVTSYTSSVSTTDLINRIKNQFFNSSFISKPIKIDFIAYHDMQAQAGLSIFDEMSKHFDCRWKIGPGQERTDAEVAVVLDHTGFHPKVNKANGYKYLFFFMHDMGDYAVFHKEESLLKDYDIIFSPSFVHTHFAKEALGNEKLIKEIGWPKYERMAPEPQYKDLYDNLENLPYDFTILYTPTWAYNYEWKELFPLFEKLECNVILKNHIYKNIDQEPTPSMVANLESCELMEQTLRGYNKDNLVVLPRPINVCSLFPYAQLAISDTSSVLIEFLPFGISIETGRRQIDKRYTAPDVSRVFQDVNYMPIDQLAPILQSRALLDSFVIGEKVKNKAKFIDTEAKSGKLAAQYIDRFLCFNEDEVFNKLKTY